MGRWWNIDKIALAANLTGTIGQSVAGARAASTAQDVASAEAQSELVAGDYNANLSRQQSRRVIGKQRAIIGASGLDTTSGTPLDIMLESARQAELEALAIQQQSRSRADSLKMKGKIAGRGAFNETAKGIVKGSTVLSDWFNNYGPRTKKNYAERTDSGYQSEGY